MKGFHKIRDWIRYPVPHAVNNGKRDERLFVAEKGSCPSCQKHVTQRELAATLHVCPACGHHFRLTAWERIEATADEGEFREFSTGIRTMNPLGFPDYEAKLESDERKTGLQEAVVTGLCRIDGREVAAAVMDFRFRGASMGCVVGEKVMRAMLVAAERRIPLVLFAASGGARMQEGILSLMQMAKTSAALNVLDQRSCPYFTVMTDPTTAGVLASFAMLGDVILAEPGALMRFAGARVVAGTTREKVPPRFPLAEFHMERGFVDAVVDRRDLKRTLSFLIRTHAAA